jgi:4-carboxymuconolactone decarboxylase
MTRVELAAIVAREGAIFLVRQAGGRTWDLPGGPLPEGQDDIPREMDLILERFGIDTPAIEGDFVETHYTHSAEGPGVLNLYAPSDWAGEPEAFGGAEGRWFPVDELAGIPMDDQVRAAVLQAFGMDTGPEEPLGAVLQFPGSRVASGTDPRNDEASDALDVLGTMSGGTPEEALDTLRQRYGELTHDVLDGIERAWTGQALDRKTRSLLVVAMLAAMGGRSAPLKRHIEGALNHGATREDMLELGRMIATYAGFPALAQVWPEIEEALEAHGMGRPR